MRIWRISNYADLSGRGGDFAALRWNYLGRRIVYCSDHPATAMLEILVNTDAVNLPNTYQLLEINVDASIHAQEADLPSGWREDAEITRAYFESFCSAASSPLLRAPSVVMPSAYNLLLNPAHSDASKITIISTQIHPLDPRFRF